VKIGGVVRILITGGTGFIGSRLAAAVLSQGHQVRCLVRETSDLSRLQGINIELYYGELRNPETLKDAVRGIDVVYHLGGVTRGRTEQDYIEGNFQATVNLLEACKNYGADHQKVLFVSSQAAGGPSHEFRPLEETDKARPISAYGRSKLLAEEAVLEFSRERAATIIRPPSVYGPGDKDFLILFKNINRGFLPMIGRGAQKISLVYLDDLLAGIQLAAVKSEANGKLFYICGDEDVTFFEIAHAIANALSKRTLTLHIPLHGVEWITRLSVLFSRLTNKASLLNMDKLNEMKQPAWLCSNQKAKEQLEFSPQVALEEGMEKAAAWYFEKGWLKK
jgi:nucleoside-diphosphate-sugar epimerase